MRSEGRFDQSSKGLTLLELMITLTIIMILASIVLPFSKMAARRAKEFELHQTLRLMREAIDEFHQDYLTVPYKGTVMANDVAGESGYPKSLEILVKGVKNPKSSKETVKRYLRKIPVDPMTQSTDWGFRCNSDEPNSEEWCKDDVYDVYTKSDGVAMDKTKYRDW
ncbi:MAG: type II secretion system protein [Nitrospirae bacterium]|nr:type II secretion system protein [Nitrospirota bacterium]